jgi:hypothetical protein
MAILCQLMLESMRAIFYGNKELCKKRISFSFVNWVEYCEAGMKKEFWV